MTEPFCSSKSAVMARLTFSSSSRRIHADDTAPCPAARPSPSLRPSRSTTSRRRSWDKEHSGRRRGSSIRKEEIDSLAATLKGLGLATSAADVATTAEATVGDTDYQVSSTSSLPASAVPS